jgi:hypothetical protein
MTPSRNALADAIDPRRWGSLSYAPERIRVRRHLLIAASDELRAMEWRPIETAPKDGTEFVVAYPKQAMTLQLIYWSKRHGTWFSKGDSVPGLEYQDVLWMPIIRPPQEP